ncbi:asparaginase [Lichenihabitans psoromatis]|uniref:asparaginase n=1 Tax=Lichenihabitans psoromatis TaxID=2528642 RepID=UPI001AECE938|nr:asparaginase [Lichenihabitans psoromatis]
MIRLSRGILLAATCALAPAPAWAAAPFKPDVFIAATGGTIAGAQANVEQHGYTAGELGVASLIAAVPQLTDIANVTGEQVMNIPSQDMDDAAWLTLAKRLETLERSDAVTGIVVTHGTDTMEETSFFVALTVDTPKPIVFTGAMRPATAIGADGPANLYDAVAVAGSTLTRACGTVVVFNDQIHSARYVYKTDTTRPDAFTSVDRGPVGAVDTGHPVVFDGCAGSAFRQPMVPIAGISALPKVDILYAYAGMGRDLIDHAVLAGAKGIVMAGVGDGNVTEAALAGLRDASAKGVVVVRSTRVVAGFTMRNAEVDDDKDRFVASAELKPSKARILLKLALLKPSSLAEIQADFDTW